MNNCQDDSKTPPATFFKGIVPKEMFSTGEEWHAFLVGFFEILCPVPQRCHMAKDYFFHIENEHHYYLFGRGMAVLAWIAIAKLIQVLFF